MDDDHSLLGMGLYLRDNMAQLPNASDMEDVQRSVVSQEGSPS